MEHGDGLRSERAEGVLTLTFDRPAHGNAMLPETVPLLAEILEDAREDTAVRAILIRGEGQNFSLGGDVQRFAAELDRPASAVQADFAARLDRLGRLVLAYLKLDVPIVVALQGGAAGAGLMYPLGADYVVGDQASFLVFAHQRIGLTPDGGVSYLLPRVVGERMARQLLLTAAKVDAAEALRLGILSRIVSVGAVDSEARAQAVRFARAPAAAVRAAKALVKRAAHTDLATHLVAERDAIVASVGHSDFAEGVTAFLAKRTPRFAGIDDAAPRVAMTNEDR